MIKKNLFFLAISKIFPTKLAYAHCDIPCGIYDPYQAQLAAISVIRMTQMIEDLSASSKEPSFEERKKIIHEISRLTKVKEEHAELLKHEIRVIWGDYLKEEHLKEYPDLHSLVFKIMKHASKTKQEINMEEAKELLEYVQEFAEIFWETKKRKTIHIKSSSPTGDEIVVPQ